MRQRFLPMYLNAFEIWYDNSLGQKLKLLFVPRADRYPLESIVSVLRKQGWTCTLLKTDFDEERLRAGIYIVPRGIQDETIEIEHTVKGALNIPIAEVQEIAIEPNSYIVKHFLTESIFKKFRSIFNTWVQYHAGTLVFTLKTDDYKLDIGSRLFEAYKAYELRIEKFFNKLYAVIDYRLKIFSPHLIVVINQLGENYDILKGLYVRCRLRGELHVDTDSTTRPLELILRGLVRDIKKLNGNYVLEVEGDIVKKDGISTRIIESGVRCEVSASECSFTDNPGYYKELLNFYKEDYHKIMRKIRENSVLSPETRFNYIIGGAKMLNDLIFPVDIGGIKYYISENPLAIGVQAYE